MKRFLLFVIVAVFLVSVQGACFGQEDKIGFVDLSKAFDEYQKTKDFDKALEKRGDIKQEQREKLVKEIRNMRDKLGLLNETAREKEEKDIEAKIRSLQEFDQDAKVELSKERDDMVKDILEEMNGIIQKYGKDNGYSIILNDRILLYSDNALNLTEEIIKILNASYKK